jgi:hypothetical protein
MRSLLALFETRWKASMTMSWLADAVKHNAAHPTSQGFKAGSPGENMIATISK